MIYCVVRLLLFYFKKMFNCGYCDKLMVYFVVIIVLLQKTLIACDYHAHLASKAGSVIGTKSPSPAFRWSGT